jgi:hypothetical protein
MSKTQAELIISPEVSKSELDRSMKQIDKAIKKVAKNTEKELGGATKEGIEKGATAGGGMSFVKKLGLAGIATAIGAAVVQGFSIAAERVGGAEGVIGEMLGDKSATGALSFAAGQGITIPTQSRSMLSDLKKTTGVDLLEQFRSLSPPHESISIQRWSPRRIRLAGAALFGILIFISFVIDNLTGAGFL